MAERILPTLPEEVIIDGILVRVPAKSIGRFRCVSKSWRSSLSSPQFTRAHLKAHIKHEHEGIILSTSSGKFTFCTVNLANENSIISRRFNPGDQLPIKVLGSCHGLLLFYHKIEGFVWSLNLFNPVTLETLIIPASGYGYCNLGLGYDSLHDDYKIVSILYEEPFSMRIYSVKMGTWKSLGNSPYKKFKCGGCFINGSIHWPASASDGGELVVAAFSLAQEKFNELPLPKGFSKSNFRGFRMLTVIGGCLALMQYISSAPGSIDFWVMQEYGVQNSWTRYAFTAEERSFRYIGVLEEDEIVYTKSSLKLVSYNWRTGVWRDMVQVGTCIARLRIQGTASFRESLISPNYGRH